MAGLENNHTCVKRNLEILLKTLNLNIAELTFKTRTEPDTLSVYLLVLILTIIMRSNFLLLFKSY